MNKQPSHPTLVLLLLSWTVLFTDRSVLMLLGMVFMAILRFSFFVGQTWTHDEHIYTHAVWCSKTFAVQSLSDISTAPLPFSALGLPGLRAQVPPLHPDPCARYILAPVLLPCRKACLLFWNSHNITKYSKNIFGSLEPEVYAIFVPILQLVGLK